MLNKPMDMICAVSDFRHRVVMECFSDTDISGLYPVGRLDKDTEGLLLVTDDGDFTHRVLSPESEIEKTYLFYAKGILTEDKIRMLESERVIGGGREFVSLGAEVEHRGVIKMRDASDKLIRENTDKLMLTKRGDVPLSVGLITIKEGKKHQVKRMLLSVGLEVVYLKRIRIGALSLDENLSLGEYRALTNKEIELVLTKAENVDKCQ